MRAMAKLLRRTKQTLRQRRMEAGRKLCGGITADHGERTIVRNGPTAGQVRNALCWCGSKLKAKNCHLKSK